MVAACNVSASDSAVSGLTSVASGACFASLDPARHGAGAFETPASSRRRARRGCVLLAMLFVGVVFATSAAAAGEVRQALRCDYCSSAAHMEGVAVQRGPGDHLVYSLERNEIRRFEVVRHCQDRGAEDSDGTRVCRQWSYGAQERSVEPGVQRFFDRLVATYRDLGGRLHASPRMEFAQLADDFGPAPMPGSGDQDAVVHDAYLFAGSSSFRNWVVDAYDKAQDAQSELRVLRRVLDGPVRFRSSIGRVDFGLAEDVSLRGRIAFPDGSQVDVVRASGAAMSVYEPGTAIDASGTPIPDFSHDPWSGQGEHDRWHLIGIHAPSRPHEWCRLVALSGVACELLDEEVTAIRCGRPTDGGVVRCRPPA